MKTLKMLFLSFAFFCCFFIGSAAAEEKLQPVISYGGHVQDWSGLAFFENDEVYVPARAFLETAGYVIEWDDATKSMIAKRGELFKIVANMEVNKLDVSGFDRQASYDHLLKMQDHSIFIPLLKLADILWMQTNIEHEKVTILPFETMFHPHPIGASREEVKMYKYRLTILSEDERYLTYKGDVLPHTPGTVTFEFSNGGLHRIQYSIQPITPSDTYALKMISSMVDIYGQLFSFDPYFYQYMNKELVDRYLNAAKGKPLNEKLEEYSKGVWAGDLYLAGGWTLETGEMISFHWSKNDNQEASTFKINNLMIPK